MLCSHLDAESIASAANHPDTGFVQRRPLTEHFDHPPPHPVQQSPCTQHSHQAAVCLSHSPGEVDTDRSDCSLARGRCLREQPDSTVIEMVSMNEVSGMAEASAYIPVAMDTASIPMLEHPSRRERLPYERKSGTSLRPHSTPGTLIWLEENYETADGVCIPRSALYMHYVDFCSRNCIQPVNAASFGKIIRQQFPQLTTRRLGTRGQSRYHYYGIAVRESSIYFQLQYSRKSGSGYDSTATQRRDSCASAPTADTAGLQRPFHRNQESGQMGRGSGCTDTRFQHPGTSSTSSSNSSISDNFYGRQNRSLLSDFPNGKNFPLSTSVDHSMMETFLVMYKTHCQRILDSVIRANFDEVQTLLSHFWTGIPSHLHSILTSNAFLNLVCACDLILFKSVTSFMLTSVTNSIPENLIRVLRKFSSVFDSWVAQSLSQMPEPLKQAKINLAKKFCNLIRRLLSISKLSSPVFMLMNNADLLKQMLLDWHAVDYEAIITETTGSSHQLVSPNYSAVNPDGASSQPHALPFGAELSVCLVSTQRMRVACQEFAHLLHREPPLDSFLQWLQSLTQKCIVFPTGRSQITCLSDLNQNCRSLLFIVVGTRIWCHEELINKQGVVFRILSPDASAVRRLHRLCRRELAHGHTGRRVSDEDRSRRHAVP